MYNAILYAEIRSSMPKTELFEDSRNLILAAAAREFAENGYKGASLRNIGKEAGVHFQLIRHYFGSKDKLWEIVVDTLFERSLSFALLIEKATRGQKPKERLHAQIRGLMSHDLENPELLMIFMQEEIRNSEIYINVYNKYSRKFVLAAGRFLREMQKADVVRKDITLPFLIEIFEALIFFPIMVRVSHDVFTRELEIETDFIEKYSTAVSKILSK